MTTSEPALTQGRIDEREAAVRRVLGYPAEGPIPTIGHYSNGLSYHRLLYSVCDAETVAHVHDWHMLIARTWCRLLIAAEVPTGGPATVYRCPCVEAAIRVYLIEQLHPDTADAGYAPSPEVVEDAAGFDYRVADGTHRWERSINEIAGFSFPALALAEASGLRIARNTLADVPKMLVEHARSCRIPYPANIVVRRMAEVGDES